MMRNPARRLGIVGLCFIATSCVTYSGVTRTPDGQLYISGGTSYWFYTSAWVRRCDVDELKLNCVELSESPAANAAATNGGAATAAPPAEAAPAPPAPPEPTPEEPARETRKKHK
jgi:hypothetical protein